MTPLNKQISLYIYIYICISWVQVTPNVILKNITTLKIFLTKCEF